MSIQILPAQLANQIAAGEVVERPASVVKELVENSLDAKATKIEIDIEKGGSKRIRIRDNGVGIPFDQLALALSRHATSKIHCLDDLEAILSLGFRGEALASISSVSRLALSSCPKDQTQAYVAQTEGRDMAVKVLPTAHGLGTTVDVVDLFFNTPARRKFLRTEKTEFSHIEDVVKKIALSRYDVAISLKHNGKMICRYAAAENETKKYKRILQICGQSLHQQLINIKLEHGDLALSGWIGTPQAAKAKGQHQYFYVNGRIMRDKLISHAIMQTYTERMAADLFPSYILYLDIDPAQVDVNVHPAKHEVRFHQPRLIHDFIVQAILTGMQAADEIAAPPPASAAPFQQDQQPIEQTEQPINWPVADGQYSLAAPNSVSDAGPSISNQQADYSLADPVGRPHRAENQLTSARSGGTYASIRKKNAGSGGKALAEKYYELFSVPQTREANKEIQLVAEQTHREDASCVSQEVVHPSAGRISKLGKALAVLQDKYLLLEVDTGYALLSINRMVYLIAQGKLSVHDNQPLISQPILIPLQFKLSSTEAAFYQTHQQLFALFGIVYSIKRQSTLVVMEMPSLLREVNLQHLFNQLSLLNCQDMSLAFLQDWLVQYATCETMRYNLSEAIQILTELEQILGKNVPFADPCFIQPVEITHIIKQLENE